MTSPQTSSRKSPASIRALSIIEPAVLVALPLFMIACALFKLPNTALLTSVAAALSLVPFFAHFELSKLRARDLMPIVVMAALGVAGRVIFAPIPSFKPVMAIVVLTGLSFGRQTGFITGSLIMLVSNIFFGHGPWTPWQMYGFGMAGYIAGSLRNLPLFQKRIPVVALGFALTFLYGVILDTWTVVGFINPITFEGVLATYGIGFVYNLTQAVATVVFLLPIAGTWPKMFDRIKEKYGIDKAAASIEFSSVVVP